jgi:hypothetical protein
MSFNPYVPCNCRIEGKIKWPSFKDKLEIRNGIIDIQTAFINDLRLENQFDSHRFCEHNQIAFELSMSQSIMAWKKYVQEKYPNKFPNFELLIPSSNDSCSHDYDKKKAIKEINELKALEEKEHHYTLDQLISLLQKALELKQNIYW